MIVDMPVWLAALLLAVTFLIVVRAMDRRD